MYQRNSPTRFADRVWAVIALFLFIAVIVSAIVIHAQVYGHRVESRVTVERSLDR